MASTPLITISKDGETLKTLPVEGDVVLGRAEGCEIRLEDRAISREHAIFRKSGSQIQVEKKSEFAPLLVNGSECTTAILKEGDIVSVGPYLIRMSMPVEAPPPPPQQETAPPPVSEAAVEVPVGEVAQVDIAGGVPAEGVLVDSPVDGGDFQNSNPPEGGELQVSGDGGLVGLDNPIDSPPADSVAPPPDEEPSGPVDEDGKTKITPVGRISAKLILSPGAANFTEYELTQDEVSIGRGKNCTIVLNDKKASRKNAVIRRVGAGFAIKDLESANGTFVNGERIQEHELSGDDVIRVGNTEIEFKAFSQDYAAKEKDFMSLPPEPEEEAEVVADFQPPMELPAGGMVAPDPGMIQGIGQGTDLAGQLPASPVGVEIGAIPGITGTDPKGKGKKKTLKEKFLALPKPLQGVLTIAFVALLYWASQDEPEIVKKPPPKKATAPTGDRGPLTFEALSADQKRFVENQHSLAFDYYRNKEYDKALFEIQKIFTLIPDYKDSREIERYAKEGKRKLEALEEEKRKKEEEAALKAKIAQLIDEIKGLMQAKKYDEAKELFSQVLAIDPDNADVASWKKEIEAYEEQRRIEAQALQVQKDINKHAWDVYREGLVLKKQGKYHSAIPVFQKVIDIGASDKSVIDLSKKMIAVCKDTIRKQRDPILAEAKQAEDAGDFSKAFNLYKKATRVDPPHPAGYQGMNRIRGVLHEKAKAIYTEAVLAESFSDFTTARKLFKDCLSVAPEDDIYHERSLRKLARYFKKEKDEEAPSQ